MGLNMSHFGKRMEQFIVDHTTTEKKFEYEKAMLEEQNEDNLEKLTKQMDDAKYALRCSIHHPELDTNLASCF
jgi:hypothetical protein